MSEVINEVSIQLTKSQKDLLLVGDTIHYSNGEVWQRSGWVKTDAFGNTFLTSAMDPPGWVTILKPESDE